MADADVILRSPDLVNFRVHMLILKILSSVWQDMFKIVAGRDGKRKRNHEGGDGLPVITMNEDSRTIAKLLRLCYPVEDPVLDTLVSTLSVLLAARKYKMQAVYKILKETLMKFAQAEPLRVYCVAYTNDCHTGMRQAARLALRQQSLEYVEELAEIPAGEYFRLLHYVGECKVAVHTIIAKLFDSARQSVSLCESCKSWGNGELDHVKSHFPRVDSKKWWVMYFAETAQRLELILNTKLVDHIELFGNAAISAGSCKKCRCIVLTLLQNWSRPLSIAEAVEKEIDNVSAVIYSSDINNCIHMLDAGNLRSRL